MLVLLADQIVGPEVKGLKSFIPLVEIIIEFFSGMCTQSVL